VKAFFVIASEKPTATERISTRRGRLHGMTALGPGCVKTPTSNLRVESLSRLR
jgi:hypothetical protein